MKTVKTWPLSDLDLADLDIKDFEIGTYWFNLSEFGEEYSRHICPQCQIHLRFEEVNVKRPVPRGARDMNLFDLRWVYRCHQCEFVEHLLGKTEDYPQYLKLEQAVLYRPACESCGAATVDERSRSALPDLPIRFEPTGLEGADLGCTACLPCEICKGTVGRDCYLLVARIAPDQPGYHYLSSTLGQEYAQGRAFQAALHRECYHANAEKLIEQVRLWVVENLRTYGKEMTLKIQQGKAEKTRLDIEAERRKQEARKKKGKCPACGSSSEYSTLDKLLNRPCGDCKRRGYKVL